MPYLLTKMIEGMNLKQSMMKDLTCEEHKQIAMFYSDQEKKYKCYECLLKQMNLHLVDGSFQKHLEEFDQIKAKSEDIIRSNSKRMNVMKSWKNEIRNSIMRVRNEFVEWVDIFTQSTIKSLKGIESQSRELSDLGGFMIDANLRRMLEELRESYVKIMLVFSEVSSQTIQEKLERIEQTSKSIKDIEA